MTPAEFKEIFTPMITKFGVQTYDAITVEEIFKAVQPLLASQLRDMVRTFIGENQRAKVSDFKERAAYILRRRTIGENVGCHRCSDGWILAENIHTGHPFGFRCPSCTAGKALSSYIPYWDDGYLMQFRKQEMS